jgi:hypothetical protein
MTWDIYHVGNDGYAMMDISVFSACNIFHNNRCSLTPEMANVLVSLKENRAMVDLSIDEDVEEE